MSITQHLNKFNTIKSQLSSVEIDFNDKIRALILLALLLNSSKAVRMVVSNSADKMKLKYDEIWDLIFVEEVRIRDFGEISTSSSTLNFNTRGRTWQVKVKE